MIHNRLLLLAFSLGAVVAACSSSGQSVYGTDYPPPRDGVDAGRDGATTANDGSVVDGGDASRPGAPCGRTAVLAGNDSSLTGAFQVDAGNWSGSSIANGAAKNLPRLVTFGGGFFGATRGADDSLQTFGIDTTFGVPTSRGQAALKTGASLAIVGNAVHLAYVAGATYQFFHASFDGNAFTPPGLDELVGTPPAVGNSAAAIAPLGADLAFVQAGTNNGLYLNVFSGGAWGMANGITGASAYAFASPAATATLAGTNELVIVYIDNGSHKIEWVARNATTKLLSAPADVNATVAVSTDDLSMTRIGSGLLLTFRGADGKGYQTTGAESGGSFTWTTPAAIAAANVDSTPSAAAGICGDDAIIAYASGGLVYATHRAAGAWTTPEVVTGALGSRVAIATHAVALNAFR